MQNRVTWASVGSFTILAIAGLKLGSALVLPSVVAVLLSLLLSSPLAWLKKRRIPESLGAGILVFGSLLMLIGGLWFLVDPAKEWMARAPANLAKVEQKLRGISKPLKDLQETAALLRLDVGYHWGHPGRAADRDGSGHLRPDTRAGAAGGVSGQLIPERPFACAGQSPGLTTSAPGDMLVAGRAGRLPSADRTESTWLDPMDNPVPTNLLLARCQRTPGFSQGGSSCPPVACRFVPTSTS